MTKQQQFVSDVRAQLGSQPSPGLQSILHLIAGMDDAMFTGAIRWMDEDRKFLR